MPYRSGDQPKSTARPGLVPDGRFFVLRGESDWAFELVMW